MNNELQTAIEIIKNGGVIIYPTDTIVGIGCDATNELAIQRILNIKKRPPNKSFIVLIHSQAQLNKYIKEVPTVAYDILDCIETPTTIIYPNAQFLPKTVVAEDGSVGIRMIKEGFLLDLLRKINVPLVSTSVNFSGDLSPITWQDIHKEILNKVDYVVTLPQANATKKASSIIKLELNGEIKIIRK